MLQRWIQERTWAPLSFRLDKTEARRAIKNFVDRPLSLISEYSGYG